MQWIHAVVVIIIVLVDAEKIIGAIEELLNSSIELVVLLQTA